jgi:outer membrane immunogenic protein
MRNKFLGCAAVGALTLAMTGTSVAAPPPVFNWSGFYIGAHAGYGEARFRGTFIGDSDTNDFRHHPAGFLGGLQFGQLWQQNTFVYGWETDASFMNWKKTYNHTSDDDFLRNKLNLLASLRARLGQTFGPTLFYVTGGLAFANGTVTFFDVDGPTTLKSNINKFGGVVGLGAELTQVRNWTWRIEGLYYIFDAKKGFDDGSHSATDKLHDVFVFRVALNYKWP